MACLPACVARVSRRWDRFWFVSADPATLSAIRIVTGLVLMYVHLSALTQSLDVIGPQGWLDARAWQELSGPQTTAWRWSLWSFVQAPHLIWLFHGLFIFATVCLTIGWWSRTAAIAVWFGQLCYIQRGFPLAYGLDSILSFLTLYLMIGPCGGAFSVDARRRRAAADAPNQSKFHQAQPITLETKASIAANVAIRCIQIHICIVYLSAGLSKLQGSSWWAGLATYYAAMSPELWPIEYDVAWIGRHPILVQLLANVSALFTLAFEIGFAFLIWRRRWRPRLLAAAVLLHLGIGVLMGLGAFGLVMLTACCAFVPPAQCRAVVEVVGRRVRSLAGVRMSFAKASSAAATERSGPAGEEKHLAPCIR